MEIRIRTLQDLRAIVRAQRKALKLNQSAVAERSGVSRRWISMFENGHETAEVGKLLAVLSALDIRLAATTEVIPAPVAGESERDDLGAEDLREVLRVYDAGDF